LAQIGLLDSVPFSAALMQKMLNVAQSRLKDAMRQDNSMETRFDCAYTAIRAAADAVLLKKGYRTSTSKPGHHHGFDVLVGSSRMRPHIRPQISSVRFAFARLEHLHRGLVGVDHAPIKDVALQSVHQRLQLHPTLSQFCLGDASSVHVGVLPQVLSGLHERAVCHESQA
jgi:hypothetical protein